MLDEAAAAGLNFVKSRMGLTPILPAQCDVLNPALVNSWVHRVAPNKKNVAPVKGGTQTDGLMTILPDGHLTIVSRLITSYTKKHIAKKARAVTSKTHSNSDVKKNGASLLLMTSKIIRKPTPVVHMIKAAPRAPKKANAKRRLTTVASPTSTKRSATVCRKLIPTPLNC